LGFGLSGEIGDVLLMIVEDRGQCAQEAPDTEANKRHYDGCGANGGVLPSRGTILRPTYCDPEKNENTSSRQHELSAYCAEASLETIAGAFFKNTHSCPQTVPVLSLNRQKTA
jgi:hypothetical protein